MYKYWFFDVDGTMTDGSIYYDEFGNEIKRFNTRDAAGIFVLKVLGAKTIIITGRQCKATERRARDLKIDYVFQNVSNKSECIKNFIKKEGADFKDIVVIGDDLNDFESMSFAGYKACPNDAAEEIKEIVDYISNVNGGYGAVRDIIRHTLTEEDWKRAISEVYQIENRKVEDDCFEK